MITLNDVKVGAVQLAGSLNLATRYVFSAFARAKAGFCVGIWSIAVVVGFISVLQATVSQSPLIFLTLAENSAGQNDLMYLAEVSNSSTVPLVNYTYVADMIRGDGDANVVVRGAVPRWYLPATLENPQFPSINTSVVVLVIDTEAESAAKLGRDWNRPPLGPNEAYITNTALSEVLVKPGVGDSATIRVSISSFLDAFSSSSSSSSPLSSSSSIAGVSSSDVESILSALNIQLEPITVDASSAVRSFLNSLGLNGSFVSPGSYEITLQPATLIAAALNVTLASQSGDGGDISLTKSVSVTSGIGSTGGKWPSALGNVVILEAKNIPSWVTSIFTDALTTLDNTANTLGLGQQLKPTTDAIRSELKRFDYDFMKQYAMQVIVQLKDRLEIYQMSPTALKDAIIDASNRIGDAIGDSYPVSVSAPLASALASSQFIRLFLDQIFGAVVFLLVLMGVLAIYSLVIGDVEAKTYEYGMLRVLGLRHVTLAHLLSIQSLSFAAPGVLIGLAIAALLYIAASQIIGDVAGVSTSTTMPGSAWIIGLVIGFAMPIIANVAPIRRALSSQLRDAIDLYHQTFSDVKVTVIYLAKLGLSTWQLSLAVLMVLVGLTTYYIVPLAFITRNYGMFLGILNAVLLGMLLGLSMVAQTLQGAAERIVVWCMIWRADTRLATVVNKNLAGHENRNRKTAYMVSIAVAFLIFAGAMFALQSRSIQDTVKMLLGSDINCISLSGFTHPLPQEDLMAYLDTVTVGSSTLTPGTTAIVAGYTFMTFPLSYLDGIRRTPVTNLVNMTRPNNQLYGLQQNYLDVTYDEYENVGEVQASGDARDVVKALHTGAGQIQIPVERLLSRTPPAVVTGDDNWVYYVCNASSVYDARQTVVDDRNSTYPFWYQCADKCDGPNSSFAVAGCTGATVSQNTTELTADIQSAYTEYVDVIVSVALADYIAASVDMPLSIGTRLRVNNVNDFLSYLAKARATVSKLPGFFFSSYRPTALFSPAIVTMQGYGRMLLEARRGIAAMELGAAGVVGSDIGDSSNVAASGATSATDNAQANAADGSGNDGSTSASRGNAYSPKWQLSDVTWTVAGNVNYSDPAQTPSHAVTAALDNDIVTFARFVSAPAWFMVDLGSCVGVGGVRFRFSGDEADDAAVWTLQAAPSLTGPFYTVTTGDCRGEDSAPPEWIPFAFPPFSARYWRIRFETTRSPATTVSVADIQLATESAEVCDADLLSLDDLSIGVPKQRLLVKLVDGFTKQDRQRVVAGLRSVIKDDLIQVQDTIELLSSTDAAVEGLNAFFTFIAVLCAVLIFFAAWLSFDANVRENSREFGVLRALGLSVAQVTRVFLYEALAVVLASFLLGTIIGLVIAISLTLQFNLFLELTFKFEFPTMIFCVVLACILLVAVLASWLPVRSFARISIANVVKGRH